MAFPRFRAALAYVKVIAGGVYLLVTGEIYSVNETCIDALARRTV